MPSLLSLDRGAVKSSMHWTPLHTSDHRGGNRLSQKDRRGCVRIHCNGGPVTLLFFVEIAVINVARNWNRNGHLCPTVAHLFGKVTAKERQDALLGWSKGKL